MMLNLLIPVVITIQLLSPNQSSPQSAITEANWQSHPKIVEIRRIVSATNSALKQKRYKVTERQFEYCQDQYFTVHRLAKNSQGMVTFYGDYSEGEDSSWDYQYFYDSARRLRFVLVTVYAANGSREQHRAYFDEGGSVIWRSRKTLKGPGYFAPQNIEGLPKDDPEKEFAAEGCKEIKPRRSSKKQ